MQPPVDKRIVRAIGAVLILWVIARLEQSMSKIFPGVVYWTLHLTAAAAGVALVVWALRSDRRRRSDAPVARVAAQRWHAAAISVAFLLLWQSALFICDAMLWDGPRLAVAQWGTAGVFLIGLAWTVLYVEARAKEFQRGQRRLSAALDAVGALPAAASTPQVKLEGRPRGAWNPFNPEARYYGRSKNRKLNQSIATLATYTIAFALAFLVLTNLQGCREIYDLPAGGGKEQTIAQTVKVQKVIRKKYVINPYSNILFNERVIDDIKLQLMEITEHAYVVGQGDAAGAGFGGGKPRGKVRFIRLEYDGGDWNQDFGVGGDLNMLVEYGIRTSHSVEKKTEARRISDLANFRKFRSPPMVYMTGQRNISTSKAEERVLREYLLENHGMIFCDNGGSRGFHNQFLALMGRVLPDVRPVPVPLDDRIHRVPFAIPFLPYVAPHGGKEALGWYKDGRWLCYYHPGDIGDAWADGHAGVNPEVWEACYQLGTNVMFYANAEYSKWVQSQKKE